ncbi:BQ5605_C001g00869 [Microbotryum silenes-dioicae]|uniref:Alpha-mannosidase n=1 Tax=Microbotryum silenes-dioicae TaxID=796604 RepID=A0A2X0M7T6_9BASI|nr:BQ5605_C001g00869 [Microbotryum silenes-dioicae]
MAYANSKPLYPVQAGGPNPLHFRGLTLGRLGNFEGGPYDNIHSVLYEHRIDDPEHIQIESWSSPGTTKTPFQEAIKQKFKPAKKGDHFGPSWSQSVSFIYYRVPVTEALILNTKRDTCSHWFRITINLPSAWANADRVQLEWDPGCEAMVYDTEGLTLQGITGGFGVERHIEFILDPKKRSSTYRLYIEGPLLGCAYMPIQKVACNAMFGESLTADYFAHRAEQTRSLPNAGNGTPDNNDPPDNSRMFQLATADLVVPRMDAWQLRWDFRTMNDLAHALPENSPLGNKCLEVCNAIMNTFKADELSTIAKCRKLAEKVFGQGWEELGHKIFKGDPADAMTWGIGNCHIDTAWLWPYSATRQKTARSWSTQLDLMDRYPEYTFVASQAQQFKWLEEDHPLLFQKIKGRVESGEFQPIGAAWVECDTNMPSGEALCRQFLYGQRYYKSRFGKYTRTFWLPDSFGYSSQLPQLCRLAGCDFFFTQKLSWSQFNAPVHTSFKWVGQDGSQVLTHMTPVNTYTAQASVDDVRNSINNHKSLQSGAATGLLAFGNGDGGGGPLSHMLENLRRCRAVADHSGELPKVTMGKTVDLFYEDILNKSEGGATLPTWNGELYLELHRGTATSHGSIKKGNRKSEILLREVEYAATLASVWGATKKGYSYPKDKIDPLWEGVLLNQFHDVLPGSGIALIYEDAEKIYAETAEKGGALLEEALRVLLPGSVRADDVNAEGDELVAVNTTNFARRDLVKIPLAGARALADAAIQLSHDGAAYVLFENDGAQPLSSTTSIEALNLVPARARAVGSDYVLSNSQLRVTVNKKGRITSLIDVELNRELIDEGKTAGFVIFEDRPLNWDAWDIDVFHLETKEDVDASSVEVLEDGPMRASIVATYHVGKSKVKATISLDAIAPVAKKDALSLVRFDTEVMWFEKHRFLKWEVPLAISSEYATYENQFGVCQRPTTRNTTWDRAKFEVVGHKFADLSEFGYGVALLNDCKYGYACEGNVLRLSLLRAPTSPDPHTDEGHHAFSFALQPHRGSFVESDVPVAGWLFNQPPQVRRMPRVSLQAALARDAVPQPFKLEGTRNIMLDTIKRGEEDHFTGKGSTTEPQTVVLRFYEAFGGHGQVDVVSPLTIESATICDLLERDLEDVEVVQSLKGGKNMSSFKLKFRGFQVVSVKVTLATSSGGGKEELKGSKRDDQWLAL